eukprot:363932-Chlamydomonas_euryale.AAC.3
MNPLDSSIQPLWHSASVAAPLWLPSAPLQLQCTQLPHPCVPAWAVRGAGGGRVAWRAPLHPSTLAPHTGHVPCCCSCGNLLNLAVAATACAACRRCRSAKCLAASGQTCRPASAARSTT